MSFTTQAGVSPRFKISLFISNVFADNIKLRRVQKFVRKPLVKWAYSRPVSLVASNKTCVFLYSTHSFSRCQWSLGLRCGSAATRYLGLRLRYRRAVDISLLSLLCVVRWRSLRRADHSSRGVLPSVE